jgi:hypothetical protein
VNPVTRRLLDRIDDPELAALATAWDAFEECLVGVYRKGEPEPGARGELEARRLAAGRAHRRWASALVPYWQTVTVGGSVVTVDPFEAALGTPLPARDVGGRREALRMLPAAREALNRLLLARAAP